MKVYQMKQVQTLANIIVAHNKACPDNAPSYTTQDWSEDMLELLDELVELGMNS